MSDRDVRYPPIADYGMLGDLRSAPLLSKQGSIDWMCLPLFDSPWIFGRLLDWDKGGYLELRPIVGTLDYRPVPRGSNRVPTRLAQRPALPCQRQSPPHPRAT